MKNEASPQLTRVVVATTLLVATVVGVVVGTRERRRIDLSSFGQPSAEMDGLLASKGDASHQALPLVPYYNAVAQILEDNYVDPIKDPQKLAIGAVKGMIESLGDPANRFMTPEQFAVYESQIEGKFQGIGVDFRIVASSAPTATIDAATGSDTTSTMQLPQIPKLEVVDVVPGGPADKAGVKVGDWVDSIDGRWVINPRLVNRYYALAKKYPPSSVLAPQLLQAQNELRLKARTAMVPAKARDILSMGSGSAIKVVWNRGDSQFATALTAAPSSLDMNKVGTDGIIQLRMAKGAASFLKDAISGKSSVRIDLRNDSDGSFTEAEKCLAVVAPTGTYGTISNDRKGAPAEALSVTEGNPHPPKIQLLVDGTTRGAAEMFALALSSRHIAQLTGEEMADSHLVSKTVPLPGGGGYTLVTGRYSVDLSTDGGVKKN